MDNQNKAYGDVKISEDVLATIAAEAAGSVEGVHAMASTLTSNIKGIIGLKNGSKGVDVTIGEGNQVTVTLGITISFGFKIQDTAEAVQVAVMKAISDMTGYGIQAVNVNVLNVDIPKSEADK